MDILTKKIRNTLIIAASILVVGLVHAYIWYKDTYPFTDNAYVKAHVIKIKPEVSGKINKLFVQDYQEVKQGDPILQIDQATFYIAKEKAKYKLDTATKQLALIQNETVIAKAKLEQHQSNFSNTEKQMKRLEKLLASGAVSQAGYDEIQTKYNVAKQQVTIGEQNLQESENKYEYAKIQINIAQQELNQANLDLEHTLIKAPADGIIMNLNQRVGDFATVGQSLLSLIETQEWWVDANFKETQLAKIRPGNVVEITLDTHPDHKLQGVVTAISSGSGAAFSLLPPENAVGNWIKVTQRFTVKILIINNPSLPPLRIGTSCQVKVDTKSQHKH